MGFALAHEAADKGAHVILISGPSHQTLHHSAINRIDVLSAQDMFDATHQHFKDADIAIFSAAVSDFKPKAVSSQKIKKKDAAMSIELVQTKDILASVGAIKKDQFLVGFALETENEIDNAKAKVKRKNLDLIVLNSLRDKGAGFKSDTNKITLIDKGDRIQSFELKPKNEVARDIFNEIIKSIDA